MLRSLDQAFSNFVCAGDKANTRIVCEFLISKSDFVDQLELRKKLRERGFGRS